MAISHYELLLQFSLGSSQFQFILFKKKKQQNLSVSFSLSVAKPAASENRSSAASVFKSDPGSPEKTHPRGDTKPEPATRLRAVPQGTKPTLAARPTIAQKPKTSSGSRGIGTF